MATAGILFPGLVTLAANAVGVGRGADLVLYAMVVISLFVWVGVYRRLHDMESRFVELARAIALDEKTTPAVPKTDRSEGGANDTRVE
jgi:hypothetical protein